MKPITDYRHIFFLGIGGIGMSALARYCLSAGLQVSGYDRQSSAISVELESSGASIMYTDDPEAWNRIPDLVIYTPAIPAQNRFRKYFEANGVEMIKRSQALEQITAGIDTIAVAGTHGKTTTSSMISVLLSSCGVKHTALLGGIATNYASNYYSSGRTLMVVEADEYDRSFLRLHPKYAVVTAMDPDHLDIYGTYENMIEGYRQFIQLIRPGGYFLFRKGLEEKIGEKVFAALNEKGITINAYDVADGDFHTTSLRVERGVWKWNMVIPDNVIEGLTLYMPGRHNVQNAIAAIAMAIHAGVPKDEIPVAMATYKGVTRRFEIRYLDAEHVIIDDYAHHPEELAAAIRAAKETYGSPVTGVFQPHLYSRTRDLAAAFAEALDTLDTPVLIDIYPAREEPIPGVSSRIIYDLMQNPNKMYLERDNWVEWIIANKPRTLITLGAGDLDKHLPELIRRLYKHERTG